MNPFLRHGGNLDAARRAWPAAPEPWLDLSTGLNPHTYNAPRASDAQRARLPLREELVALRDAAAAAFDVVDATRVAPVAGAEAALRALPLLGLGHSVALDPALYASHDAAWRAAGARIVAPGDDADICVVINPANPTGAVTDIAAIRALADRQSARNGWLVIDESFADTDPEISVALWPHPRLIVLRSFGKFFGLAGLRLGFVVADQQVLERLHAAIGDWPVSADAIVAGTHAYRDLAWIQQMRLRLADESQRLGTLLRAAGFETIGGTKLFQLTRSKDAQRRFDALAAQGILTRPFQDQPDWLRFGLPPADGWQRLAISLERLA
ncbi:aminotransferase class I/II-fold pyridoxal phosphate-dependent enzyme [Roseiterribacter gracilis]|uniref:Aminotransferase n=1 Tax=Roseiterribacter gracilis TaxID=2812848 RepID=A0A8S8X808_9PROT|nr:threonine-phosphate decarboxylase [Rhodospirillales bacterium TMPK1]